MTGMVAGSARMMGAIYDPAAAYAAGTLGARLKERQRITEAGAVPSLVVDQLAPINAAIAAADSRGALFAPAGDYLVSAAPTNTYGVQIEGPGRLLKAITGGYQQLNTYADRHQHITGREYLAAFHSRIIGGFFCNVLLTGDSTTAGTAVAGDWVPDALLRRIARARGIYNQTFFNRGQAGMSSGDWETTYVAGDITNGGNTPSLFIVRWGINDPWVPRTLAQFVASMRASLAAIRAALPVQNASILLMTPNATSDTPSGRDERWYEQAGPALRQIAREYQCAFFDTYAWCKDARGAANIWMDDPYADGRAIHPLDVMNAAIFSAVGELIYPIGLAPVTTNKVQNLGSTDAPNQLPTALPATYDAGLMWHRATQANGWPLDGCVMTFKHKDGTYALQFNYDFASGKTDLRWRVGQGAAWFPWSGGEMAFGTLTDAATIAWDAKDGHAMRVTLAGNRTLGAPTNINDGAELTLRVQQDGAGGRTLAYHAAYKFAGGVAPVVTATAGAVSVLRFKWDATSGTALEVGRFLDVK